MEEGIGLRIAGNREEEKREWRGGKEAIGRRIGGREGIGGGKEGIGRRKGKNRDAERREKEMR